MDKQIGDYLSRTNYYHLLNVKSNCTQKQIKLSYRNLALKFHPDKNKAVGAKQVFAKLSVAYAALYSQDNRRNYDLDLKYKSKVYSFNGNYENSQDNLYSKFTNSNKKQFKKNSNQQEKFKQYNENQKQYQKFKQNNKSYKQPKGYFEKNWVIIIGVFIFFYFFLNRIPKNDQPLYRLRSSKSYSFEMQTQILKIKYYVSKEFFQLKSPQLIKQSIDRTLNSRIIKDMIQVCQQKVNQRKHLQYLSINKKIGPQRMYYINKAKQVNLQACKYIKQINEKDPNYIKYMLSFGG